MLRLRVKAEGGTCRLFAQSSALCSLPLTSAYTFAEAGEAPAAPATDPEIEQDLIDISDIKFVLGKLSDTRDMTFSEVSVPVGASPPPRPTECFAVPSCHVTLTPCVLHCHRSRR